MSIARISRDPFTAALSRSENPIFASRCVAVSRSSFVDSERVRLADVDQRILRRGRFHVELRDLVRKHSTIGEEFAQSDRHVGPGEKRLERLLGNPVQSVVGRLADLGVAVLEQQHQDGELLVCARCERALRREEADIALDLASLEGIEKGSWVNHRLWR